MSRLRLSEMRVPKFYVENKALIETFQKVDQHTEGKWLIHGTKRHKDNHLQRPELPCRIS